MNNNPMNPMLSQLTQANPAMGMLSQMIGMVKAARDPMGKLNQMAMNSPQLSQVMQMVQQNGGNAKQLFYSMAQQRGVDPNVILSQLGQFW